MTSSSAFQEFPHLGLTIKAVDEFILLCGGRSALEGKDTTAVNDHQKQITGTAKTSYCLHLVSKGDRGVGPASGH